MSVPEKPVCLREGWRPRRYPPRLLTSVSMDGGKGNGGSSACSLCLELLSLHAFCKRVILYVVSYRSGWIGFILICKLELYKSFPAVLSVFLRLQVALLSFNHSCICWMDLILTTSPPIHELYCMLCVVALSSWAWWVSCFLLRGSYCKPESNDHMIFHHPAVTANFFFYRFL